MLRRFQAGRSPRGCAASRSEAIVVFNLQSREPVSDDTGSRMAQMSPTIINVIASDVVEAKKNGTNKYQRFVTHQM